MSSAAPPIVAVEALTKEFAGVHALRGVSLSLRAGEVHGLIGENGAGKSTLMNLLSGLLQPTSGRILLSGEPVTIHGAANAQRRGVVMIHQELNLIDELSVADNIVLGRERGRMGFVSGAAAAEEARRQLGFMGCDLDVRQKVKHLSIAQQQMVEIAKALSQDARVLIMDEPTAVLTRREVTLLLGLIRRLRAQGVTVVYISHILPEVLDICDRITVLRDGQVVTTLESKEGVTQHTLANLMVGREITQQFPLRQEPQRDVVLRVQSFSVPGRVDDASFHVRRGEIFGFAGLIGAGRTELAEGIVGLRPASGSIELDAKPATLANPRDAIRQGVAYVSEDRRGRGLVMRMGIAENTTLVTLPRYARPFVNGRAELGATMRFVRDLAIKIGRPRDPVSTLSGGNQQKVALAKWLDANPRVLILDEPTRGVDVGAKAEIYRLIGRLAADGMACIVISSEMTELLGLCHRIAVMRGGRIAATLDGPTATEQSIMAHAAFTDAQPAPEPLAA